LWVLSINFDFKVQELESRQLGKKIISLFQNFEKYSGANPAPWKMGTKILFPGLKRPVYDDYRSIPSSVKVKNEWRCTFNPPIYLDDRETDNFTF
jgi:hypothetical protein